MTDQSSADSTLTADWATIWQSEWAAIAVDPEAQEAWQRLPAAWATLFEADRPSPTPGDAAARSPRPVPTPWAAATVDAPDARDAAIASLLDRVAELERRAAAESAARPAANPA